MSTATSSRAFSEPAEASAAPHACLRLLAQVLRRVVQRAAGLAGRPRALPAAEGLIAGPRAGRRALRAVRVADASVAHGEETLGLIDGSVETRGKAVVARVRARERLVEVVDRCDKDKRSEQLPLPQRMVEWRAGDGRRAIVTMRERAVIEAHPPMIDHAPVAERADLRARILAPRDRRGIDHRPHPVRALGQVA